MLHCFGKRWLVLTFRIKLQKYWHNQTEPRVWISFRGNRIRRRWIPGCDISNPVNFPDYYPGAEQIWSRSVLPWFDWSPPYRQCCASWLKAFVLELLVPPFKPCSDSPPSWSESVKGVVNCHSISTRLESVSCRIWRTFLTMIHRRLMCPDFSVTGCVPVAIVDCADSTIPWNSGLYSGSCLILSFEALCFRFRSLVESASRESALASCSNAATSSNGRSSPRKTPATAQAYCCWADFPSGRMCSRTTAASVSWSPSALYSRVTFPAYVLSVPCAPWRVL